MSQVIKPFVYTGVSKCRELVGHHGFQTWVDGTVVQIAIFGWLS